MKKIAKLSLVAAVAVAGLSTANAQPLEEAIKNVDISGTVGYRYDDRTSENQAKDNFTQNSYKVAVSLKSKINDDLTAVTRTIVGDGTAMVPLQTDSGDGNADISLSQANFVYTGIANTTIIAGKQAVPSPFAVQVDAVGDEDTGTGITAVTNLGAVTLAGTYLNQTNLVTAGADIAGIGAMVNVGPVALDAWFLDVAETSATNDGHTAYTFGAKGSIAMIKAYARYSAVDHDASDEKESLWKIGASAKVGIIGLGVDYGQTNDVDTLTTGVGLTEDADADVNLQGWKLNLNKKDDASLLKVSANADILSGLNTSVTYADLDSDDVTVKANEVYGQVSYKMGKNFSSYVRYGVVDFEQGANQNMGRVQIVYSF